MAKSESREVIKKQSLEIVSAGQSIEIVETSAIKSEIIVQSDKSLNIPQVTQKIIEIVETGQRGPAGADGVIGRDGVDGATGPTGPAGADGNTILNGLGTPSDTLGDNDDFYIDTQNNLIFGPKTAGVWGSGTSTTAGPKGDTGDTGAAGPQGPQGVAGPTGATGDAGPQGIQGVAGNDGADGATGPKGDTGATGATGPQGPQGDAGSTGATGPAGADGVDGKTVLNGTAVPTTEGVDGDFYIKTDTSDLYGPKTGGSWGSATSLIGAQGPAGNDGADGATGPQGIQGITGNDGADGATGPKGDTGDTGATGPQGPQGDAGPTGATGPAGADGADGSIGNVGKSFSAYNNSQQTSSNTAFDDITTWTQDHIDDVFAFNATTGVLTVNHTGTVLLNLNATLEQTTGNNRAVPRMRVLEGTTQINGMRAEGYTRQTGVGDRQAMAVAKPLRVTSGDTFKTQMGTNSASFTHRLVSGCCNFSAIILA